MNVIRHEKNAVGLPVPNEVTIVLCDELPGQEFVTCSFVFAFDGQNLLMTNLIERGWDIPGGHLEAGESPIQAARRELYEETGALISSPKMLGYQMIRLHGSPPEKYKYPHPDSYLVFFSASVTRYDDFVINDEAVGRGLFTPSEARTLPWVRDHLALYEEALRRVL